jgi:hypothetical protein
MGGGSSGGGAAWLEAAAPSDSPSETVRDSSGSAAVRLCPEPDQTAQRAQRPGHWLWRGPPPGAPADSGAAHILHMRSLFLEQKPVEHI